MTIYCLTWDSLHSTHVHTYRCKVGRYTVVALNRSTHKHILTSYVYLEWALTAFTRRLAFSSACRHRFVMYRIVLSRKCTCTCTSGLLMALRNAWESLVADRMVSVRPYLNHRVPALSYTAVGCPYILWRYCRREMSTTSTSRYHGNCTHVLCFIFAYL